MSEKKPGVQPMKEPMKPQPMKEPMKPMKEPMKPHGDKIDPHDQRVPDKDKRPGGASGAGEPQVTPLEPEQGGIGGP